MQEPYITSEELFNSIKEDFYTYDNAGLIDDGQFYRHVTYILGLLGISWYKEEEDFFEVVNYQIKLPSNFYQLDQAYRCYPVAGGNRVLPDGVVLTERNFDHFPVNCEDDCTKCPPPSDCISNKYQQLVVQRNTFVETYNNFSLLRIGNKKTRSMCKGDCANLFAQGIDSITIQNGTMYTNFREGNVYIKYLAFPIDEETNLPLIPNNEKVMKCIEYYIKSKVLENFWVNGDGDVAQKISYFQAMYKEALGDAMVETKLPSFNTLVNAVKVVRKRLNVYQLYPASSGFLPVYNIANTLRTFI